MENSRYLKWIKFIIIITPIIDILNGVSLYIIKSNATFSPGQILRLLILIINIYLCIKVDFKNFFIILISMTLVIIRFFYNIYDLNSIINDMLFYSKILYVITFLLLTRKVFLSSSDFENELTNLLASTAVFLSFSLIVTKILGIGQSSYNDSIGYKGLFMGVNDFTNTLIFCYPFLFKKMVKDRINLVKIIKFIMTTFVFFIIGTKAAIIFLAIILTYFLLKLMNFKNLKKLIVILIFLSLFLFFGYIKYFSYYKDTILNRYMYFYDNLNPLTFLLSQRNITAQIAFSFWNLSKVNYFLGLGFKDGSQIINSFLPGHGMIEMDFLDIIYFYGIINFLILTYGIVKMFIKSISVFLFSKGDSDKKDYSFLYILSIIISFTGGHVLLSPLAGVYFAVIYSLCYKSFKEIRVEGIHS
ncbi:O-antigen ligase family protein [Candidatus Clostridium stratigraminis]|uniref:O-antigen ligase family protein n=1 Tax=Candidatus Clostridium stratigraminis TaxID=3381661 RepID=A0ABW8T2Y6_9CLOT